MLLLLCVRARRRMRSAWLAYEEKTMPLLKEEKPGLKMSQYKDLLWKMWQKAPENVSELGHGRQLGATRLGNSMALRQHGDLLQVGLCCTPSLKEGCMCCSVVAQRMLQVHSMLPVSVQSGLIADAASGAQFVPRSR